jgi:cytochrome c oxidase subunit 6c
MAGEVAGVISKPVLRGLHNAQIKRNLIVATGLVVITFVSMKFLYNEPRKQKYAEYYK